MAPKIERITEGSTLGEGPHWDITTQTLYFVDILGKSLNKYDPVTKKHTKISLEPGMASFIVPLQGKKDHFIMSLNKSLTIVKWNGASDKYDIIETLVEAPYPFNDGKADSTGRIWCGTLDVNLKSIDDTPDVGTLYSFGPNKRLQNRLEKIRAANGLAWNDKLKKFYYIDSLRYAIHQYDFDIKTGDISNEKQLFSLKKQNIQGVPDGMTIDSDGNLWVAVFGASRVIKIDGQKPDTLLDTIQIPTPQVTSVAFGGANLDELYVTTGALEREGQTPPLPDAGATFKVTGLGVKGLPMHNAIV